jgi:2',3'-cyclic-nucleotide 2'-phosphodiesterase (5'-nucleotidase family)
MRRILAALAAALALAAPLAAADEDPARGETALGDFVADAVRNAAQADVALIQAAIFRLPLARSIPGRAGNGSESADRRIRSALAYADDRVAVGSLEGRRLLQALERSLSLVPQPNKGFLQVSALTVEFKPSAPPERRIVRAMIGTKPLDSSSVYKVAMPLSLAKGALGYFRVFDGVAIKQTEATILQAVMSSLAAGKKPTKPEGRIRAAK